MFTSKINFLFSNVKPRQKEFEFKIALDQKPEFSDQNYFHVRKRCRAF